MTKPLNSAFNVCVLQIASRLFPAGFDVSPNAPHTLPDLVAHVKRTGRMCVWDGASDSTIFADPETNYAFRAWHDHAHLRGPYPFTPAGEALTAAEMCRDMFALYGRDTYLGRTFARIINAEVMGQLHHKERYGNFPRNQRAFVLSFLESEEHALSVRW